MANDSKDNAADRSYCVISPCRDEAQYARTTLESMVHQTVRPTLWLIVDDGSTDATPEILAEYESKYDFIRVLRRDNRGQRSVGPGVIEAFYAGLDAIDPSAYAYLCKLDLDLDIPERYFELILQRMEANPRLGTCSGKPYFKGPRGQLISEACGDEMSVGMIKFYRRACFEEVGGFVRQVMWDGIDCHRCRMLGWISRSWDDEALRFIHLRPMGSSQKSMFTGRMRHGFGQYFMGTGPAYMTASALFRMTRPPHVIGGLAMLLGYIKAAAEKTERYDDDEFRAFLAAYQRACLLKGKAAATRELDEAIERRFANSPQG